MLAFIPVGLIRMKLTKKSKVGWFIFILYISFFVAGIWGIIVMSAICFILFLFEKRKEKKQIPNLQH